MATAASSNDDLTPSAVTLVPLRTSFVSFANSVKCSSPGLQHLKGLTNLLYLELLRTDVTATGVKKLRQALPKCKISH